MPRKKQIEVFQNYSYLRTMKTSIEIENKLKELKPILFKKYNVDKIVYFGTFSLN
jgi:hypothetical protein